MTDDLQARYRFAYQPILNAAQASVGVELQFDVDPAALADTPADAGRVAAETIIHAFIHSGLDSLLRRRRAWVPASGALLASGLITLLPAAKFVLCVDPRDDRVSLPLLMQLRHEGFPIAMPAHALAGLERAAELLAVTDILSVNIGDRQRPEIQALTAALLRDKQQMLARNVDSADDFAALHDEGYDYFQGYCFARLTEASGSRVDPRRITLLDLLAKLTQDVDDAVLDDAFRNDPALSLHLLRLVNSSAFALQVRISSIKHAFSVLGRAQLTRWLQVLLYSLDSDNDSPSPLLELALRRARFLEYSLKYLHHQKSSHLMDEAYMTGLLSLADVLIGWPMPKLVEKLQVADAVRDALLGRSGVLGRLLDLTEALEQADFDRASEIGATLNLPDEAVMHAQSVALSYASALAEGRPQPEPESP